MRLSLSGGSGPSIPCSLGFDIVTSLHDLASSCSVDLASVPSIYDFNSSSSAGGGSSRSRSRGNGSPGGSRRGSNGFGTSGNSGSVFNGKDRIQGGVLGACSSALGACSSHIGSLTSIYGENRCCFGGGSDSSIRCERICGCVVASLGIPLGIRGVTVCSSLTPCREFHYERKHIAKVFQDGTTVTATNAIADDFSAAFHAPQP